MSRHPGELGPRVGFTVTNMSCPAERVIAVYNNEERPSVWIKERKGAMKRTRLSYELWRRNDGEVACTRFRRHGVRLF